MIQTLGYIALWYCFVVGGLLALGLAVAAAWWAFDLTLTRLGYTKQILLWYRERLRNQHKDYPA